VAALGTVESSRAGTGAVRRMLTFSRVINSKVQRLELGWDLLEGKPSRRKQSQRGECDLDDWPSGSNETQS
jgi:hypothetical protein